MRAFHAALGTLWAMEDEIVLTHRHDDAERHQMAAGNESRVDGLRVREYECPCGFSAAVLSRTTEEQIGPSWPFRWSTRPA